MEKMRKNELQFFADAGTVVNGTEGYVNAGTGSTAGFDGDKTLAPELKAFYDTELLENARSELFYAQFAKRQALPANHHGSVDADYPDILNALSPQVMVINVWQDVQPRPDNTWNQRMGVMTGTDFYMTNLASSNKSSFTTGLSLIKSEYGHVVVRVQKGGLKYKVYALDDQKSDFSILKSKEYTSR